MLYNLRVAIMNEKASLSVLGGVRLVSDEVIVWTGIVFTKVTNQMEMGVIE